ncbi:hypothetical protein F5888DRAFT_233748 [Russula emetica]|nr:hypothetical protein F5888DRAFT_233748 [Russula emetica]
MVNYQDPHTVTRDFTALINFHHVLIGLFLWELLTTFDYEWDVIRGRRPYRRTIWIYTFARVATLMTLVDAMIGFYDTGRINCQAYATFGNILPGIAFAAASLLIVLRIMAIWNGKKIMILIAMGVWVTDVGFLIDGCVRVKFSTLTILDPLGLFANRRSVTRGRMSSTPAPCSTQRA